MRNILKVGMVLVILTVLFCTVEEKIPLYVWGIANIEKWKEWEDWESFTMVNLVSDPIPKEATVKVNDIKLEEIKPVYVFWTAPGLYFIDTLTTLKHKTTYNLDVDCDAGKCNASAKMPGSITVTAPDSIHPNSDLTLSWNKAENAMWYYVWVWYWGYEEASFDTFFITTDTQVTLSGKYFPEEGTINWEIGAGNGPSYGWEASSEGNVEGDGYGFWTAMVSEYYYVDVVEEGSSKSFGRRHKLSRQEKLRNLLECFAPYNKNAQAILEIME